MKLRRLEKRDASLMLEWMHDDSVVHFLSANFAEKTIQDCEQFIEWSQSAVTDMNLAIVDDCDEYMGTVSLKHINQENGTAEFAITVRKNAMGKGVSAYGMTEILRLGIEELGLSKIYWCVSRQNERAVRFYDKHGYQRTHDAPDDILVKYTEKQRKSFIWYFFGATH